MPHRFCPGYEFICKDGSDRHSAFGGTKKRQQDEIALARDAGLTTRSSGDEPWR